MSAPACRFCAGPLQETFVDLGSSPLANAFLTAEQLSAPEPTYPLHAYVCAACFLVQLEQFETPERIFGNYPYFSSYSDSWVEHGRRYCDEVVERYQLDAGCLVIEVASNDGYLLQHFKAKGIPVLGIEPARNVAAAAIRKGIPTETVFFGVRSAQQVRGSKRGADLLIANNVLAHVPDLNDFVAGLREILGEHGVGTVEFPHLLCLMQEGQFDTIYHEHFSYFSFTVAQKVLAKHGLRAFDVQKLPTHGGSLRVHFSRATSTRFPVTSSVASLLEDERGAGLGDLATYRGFAGKVARSKQELLDFLGRAKREGKRVVAYGAAAKGNTLLNYCGVRDDLVEYVVDRSPHKQGLFLPGSHLPIRDPADIERTKPDYLLLLAWNLAEEIRSQMSFISRWGGRFVVPIPAVRVLA